MLHGRPRSGAGRWLPPTTRTWPHRDRRSVRAPAAQVLFDAALGEDKDNEDNGDAKGFAVLDESSFYGQQTSQVTPRRSQFQQARTTELPT